MSTRSNSIASSAEEECSAHSFDRIKTDFVRGRCVLKPVSFRSAEKGSNDPYQPDIDIVHVESAASGEERLLTEDFLLTDVLQRKSASRQWSFRADVSCILKEEYVQTLSAIDIEARRLLKGLEELQAEDPKSRKAIIFVAYDLGSLIVKKALAMARYHDKWASIFAVTARLIFCGCFQRGADVSLLERTMFGFLLEVSEDRWAMSLTFSAVRNLAIAVEEVNETFLASKITLRSRMFSLFASEPQGKWVKKYFTKPLATFGIATELTVQEENGENAFPSLANNTSTVIGNWIAEPPEAAMEITLMSLVPPECRIALQFQPPQSDQLHASSEYNTWLSGNGVRILHIHSPGAIGTADVAEQIGHEFVSRRQADGRYWARPFAFDFATTHNTRQAVQEMMVASFLHFFSFACNPGSTSCNSVGCTLLQDQFALYNAWLEDDARNMFRIFVPRFSRDTNVFLLYGIDHCHPESRAVLWSILADMAEMGERSLKFVVTSGDANLLSSEIGNNGVHVHEYRLPQDDNNADHAPLGDEANIESMVRRLSPTGQGRERIRDALFKAQHIQRPILENYIHFVERRTCWPKTESRGNLLHFCSLLGALDTDKTPGATLSNLLEDSTDQEQTEIALAWILCGYRPLSPLELAEIVMHTCRSQGPQGTTHTPETTPREVLQHIRSTLGSFVDFSSCQVRTHPDVAKLMKKEEHGLWGRVRATARQLTLDFLLTYLKSPDTQERLRILYLQYEARVKVAGQSITPPVVQTGEDVLFYAVQALPYHLSRADVHVDTQSLLKDPLGPYSAWARFYWAMSNPFSRPNAGPCSSAWATWRMVSSGPANRVTIIDTSSDHNWNEEGNERSDRDSAEIPIMEDILNAVRANKEDMAVNLAQQLVKIRQSVSQNCSHDVQWPPSVLWRATWLNMDELVALLLNNGVQADDSTAAYAPSPLYLAAILGFTRLVKVLLDHGADIRVRIKPLMSTPMSAAAAYGRVDVVKALIQHSSCLLDEASPVTPLYEACSFGASKVVEVLLRMKADVDQPGTTTENADSAGYPNWSNPPLVAACEHGYVDIVRLLLEHGAEVNAPARFDTAISWAAIDGRSIDCVRLLLQYGADPTHDLIDPPLLTQIIQEPLIPDDEKVFMFEMLVHNDNPALINQPNAHASSGTTPLMEAALQGNVIAARWLLEHGADTGQVDKVNRHALYHAVQSKNRAVIDEILANQAPENRNIAASDGGTVLDHCLDDVSLFQVLLDANFDPEIENNKVQTALNSAVVNGAVEVVRLLLERNVNIHHRDEYGWSPILDATGYRPNPEIARLLLEHGADPKDSTSSKWNPIHQATGESRPDVLRVLLEFREYIDLDARDEDDETALSRAYRGTPTEKEKECIKLLIRAGADVNYARDDDGETLLMIAANAVTPDPELDNCLLMAPKINVNAISRHFGTALTVACRNANFDLASKLMDRGVDVNFYAPIKGSTPLMAACIPWLSNSQRVDLDDYFSRSEQIVRELISRGADINQERGIIFFNALSAAALLGGSNVVNCLLDKGASVGKRDPFGRQAIHFSAASGLRNFEGLCLAADDDIRTPDNFGKNVLHWAAQFGHVKTVRSIMRRLKFLPARDRRDFVNSRDIDGWTALAWASRPVVAPMWICEGWTLSEELDHAATIRFLIEEGADPAVEFRVHGERSVEMLTPWKMAKRCQLELPEETFRMLKPMVNRASTTGSTNDQEVPEESEEGLRYVRRDLFCAVCFTTIFGIAYQCNTCIDYGVCSKCYTRIDQYHCKPLMDSQGGDDGPTHDFRVVDDYIDEFERSPRSSPSVKSITDSMPGDAGSSNEDQVADTDKDGQGQTGRRDQGHASDSIDGLDLSDLSDLEDDEEGTLDDMDI